MIVKIERPRDVIFAESTAAPLFGKIAEVKEAVSGVSSSSDVATILTAVTSISSTLGGSADTGSSSTIFGDLNSVEDLLGAVEDDAATETMFGKINDIRDNADKGKQSSDSALFIVQGIEEDLGIDGQTPMYDRIEDLESELANLETIAEAISEGVGESEELSIEMLDTLGELVNQSAESLGLDVEIKQLTDEERQDTEKVQDKLVEIDAKLSALQESVGQDEIVVKTYFESAE